MKQVKLDSTLWVLSTTPYRITEDTDVSTINVHCNYIDQFRVLNPSLNLTPYNYLILTKETQPYYEYLDDKEIKDFTFPESIINSSCFVDETKTMSIQQLVVPEDYDGEILYYLDGVLLDSSSIILVDASNYKVSADAINSSIYADDLDSSYIINFQKYKRDAVLSFANSVVNETVEDVTEYSGQVQEISGAPQGVNINYYLGNTLLTNGQIEISNLQEGVNTYTIYAKIENDPVYNNAQASYTLNITMEISSYENKYFTVEPLGDGTLSYKGFSTSKLYFSKDKGKNWEILSNNAVINITTGENIILKGLANEITFTSNGMGYFSINVNYNVSGNVMSLIYGDNFKNQYILPNKSQGVFAYLCSNGSNTNNYLINAENLILPANTMTQKCYSHMFNGCKKLLTAPKLPATELANTCYDYMFYMCESLINAPELPATSLMPNCYLLMFNRCNKLNYIKAACPPNSETDSNKLNWVQNVAATGTYIISDPNYNPNTDGIIYSNSCVPVGWTVKDYQGNVINPKVIVSFTNPNNLLNRGMLNEQFAMPSYQITTNPAAAASEVVYYYSTDNSTWTTTIPQYLDTTTEGTFTYYIKAEISNSATYIDTTEVYTYTYKVVDYIRDFSAYTCLSDIDVYPLLDTSTLQFNDFILDLSSTISDSPNGVQLRDTVTNQTGINYNYIKTYSVTQDATAFNVKENRIGYKIQDVGSPVLNHPGYWGYHFTNTMQIYNIQSNVSWDKVYFKLPNYNVSNSSLELSSNSVTLDYDSDHPMGSADLPTVDIISGSGEYIISDFYYIETGSEPIPETGEYDYQEGGVVFAFIDEETNPPCIRFEFSEETGSGGYSGYFIITDVQTEQEVQLNVETIGDVNTGEPDQYDNGD